MHINQHDYNRLLSYTKTFVQNKHHIDAGDVVNDVLLDMLSRNEIFTYERGVELVKKNKTIYEKTLQELGNDFSKADTQRVCKDCKELFPVGAFYILKQETKLAVASYCKKCQKKRSLTSYYKGGALERKAIKKQERAERAKIKAEEKKAEKKERPRLTEEERRARNREKAKRHYHKTKKTTRVKLTKEERKIRDREKVKQWHAKKRQDPEFRRRRNESRRKKTFA